MQFVYVTKGLPGCGKSSLGEQMAKENKKLRLVSKDDIRKLLYRNAKWSASKEPLVVQMRDVIISELLDSEYDVFVHDTNLAGTHIEDIQKIVNNYNRQDWVVNKITGDEVPVVKARLIVLDLTSISVEECIKRDAVRENSVGYRVIIGMAEKNLPVQYDEFRVKYPTNNDVLDMLYMQRHTEIDNDKKNCIIVDIDGTLAIMGDRSPYDLTMVHIDKVYKPLSTLLSTLSKDYTIIFLSGREAVSFNETRTWLQDNGLWFFDSTLIMREIGDQRQDSIVKQELWLNHIDMWYNTIAVFDDRKQVIEMWRKLGLPCYQVNWGDF